MYVSVAALRLHCCAQGFPVAVGWGLLSAYRVVASPVAEPGSRTHRLRSCGHGLSSPWDLPGSGIKALSPAVGR